MAAFSDFTMVLSSERSPWLKEALKEMSFEQRDLVFEFVWWLFCKEFVGNRVRERFSAPGIVLSDTEIANDLEEAAFWKSKHDFLSPRFNTNVLFGKLELKIGTGLETEMFRWLADCDLEELERAAFLNKRRSCFSSGLQHYRKILRMDFEEEFATRVLALRNFVYKDVLCSDGESQASRSAEEFFCNEFPTFGVKRGLLFEALEEPSIPFGKKLQVRERWNRLIECFSEAADNHVERFWKELNVGT